MSNERDELANILHKEGAYCGSCGYEEGDCSDCATVLAGYAEAILAAGYRKPRTITTAEDLEALPTGTVVLSDEARQYLEGWRLAYQKWDDGYWHRGARSGSTHPDNIVPASVLYEPGVQP